MSSKFKLQSKFLNCLNEAIQKLALDNTISIVKKPIMEADGNFTSVVKATDTFDPTKLNSNIMVDKEDEDPDKINEKTKLVTQAVDKITQSLKATDELQSVLNQIKKINEQDGYNDWELNEKGNTAELKNKNAQIFKQNDNLCLSYNNKIEIFKSVEELHDWLRKHNFPLPKDITLHEANEGGLTWEKILKKNKTTTDGKHIGDTVKIDPDKELENKLSYNRSPVKMGKDTYKDAMRWLKRNKDKDHPEDIEDSPNLNSLREEDSSDLWYLQYKDNNPDENLYLNNNWVYGNLLTNNLEEAAIFMTREDAMKELDKVYLVNDTEAPLAPIQVNSLGECFGGGVTTGTLGAAVQYTGSKKDESLKEEEENELEEGFYGFPGTPFEKEYYINRYKRASDYIKWINAKADSDEEKINIDPNYEENMATAIKAIEDVQKSDRGSKHWSGVDLPPGEEETMFYGFEFDNNGLIVEKDKEQFLQKVKDINEKYGLKVDPNLPVVSYFDKDTNNWLYKIDPINKKERKKWINDWYVPNRFNKIKGMKAAAKKRVDDYQKSLSQPKVADADKADQFANNPNLLKVYNSLVDIRNNTDIDDIAFYDKVTDNKDKFTPEEYNSLIDRLIKDGDDAVIDLNYQLSQFLQRAKVKTQTESAFNKEFCNLLDSKTETPLKEDDSPADFATNLKANGDTATTDIKVDAPDQQADPTNDTGDFDMDISDDSGNTPAKFGDLNISMGGDYGPEDPEGEPQDFAPDLPEYRIVDVLINDDDETDINVKVQNLDTGEIETKKLNEIDI